MGSSELNFPITILEKSIPKEEFSSVLNDCEMAWLTGYQGCKGVPANCWPGKLMATWFCFHYRNPKINLRQKEWKNIIAIQRFSLFIQKAEDRLFVVWCKCHS